MASELHATRRSITSRINTILSDFGLENSVSGGKFDELSPKQSIDPATGYWSHSSMISKPSRLIVHFSKTSKRLQVTIPSQNTNGNFAYANTANRSVGGLSVRILPVLKIAEANFTPLIDWEWLLWYCFWPSLARGSSGQIFDGFSPTTGTFTYMGRSQPYIAAGLVTLNEPGSVFEDKQQNIKFTYQQATESLTQLIKYAPTAPELSHEMKGKADA